MSSLARWTWLDALERNGRADKCAIDELRQIEAEWDAANATWEAERSDEVDEADEA